jgi:hypothetical protein
LTLEIAHRGMNSTSYCRSLQLTMQSTPLRLCFGGHVLAVDRIRLVLNEQGNIALASKPS